MTAVSLFRARNGAAALEGTLFNNPTWITFWAIVWAVSNIARPVLKPLRDADSLLAVR